MKRATHEVAACDASYQGKWRGAWEACELLQLDPEITNARKGRKKRKKERTCTVRIVSDGELCANVPFRFVRPAGGASLRGPGFKPFAIGLLLCPSSFSFLSSTLPEKNHILL